MELWQLKYFLAVADELNYGRAAARLNVAQPSVTRAVQGLENELIEGASERNARVGRIRRRPRLGGLLNYYCRAA